MSTRVRVGFVGVGGMGQAAHLRNYSMLPDVDVVAIAEIRPKLGRLVGERYGIPKVYTSGEEMLRTERLDGIVASQGFTHHGSILPGLYGAGVPIFTEKPLAGSVAVGKSLLAQLKDNGSWHMVGYHKRSDPATMYAKAEIERLKESGELGALKYVRIIMPAGDWVASGFTDNIGSDEPAPPIADDPPAPNMTSEQYGDYLGFVNYYIHQVNLMRHLLGERYNVTYADPTGVVMTVQSVTGVAGTIELSPYQTTIDWQESALVAFERGYIKLTLPAPLAYNRPGHVEILKDPGNGVVPTTVAPSLPWVHAMRSKRWKISR
jgi:predicted dehydrogenase